MKRLIALLALAALALGGTASAKTCELNITGNDQLQYDKTEMVIESDCDEVTVTLTHVGKLPVEQMGHNWALAKTENWKEVAQAGQGAGLENDYLPPGDERVIVQTGLVGGGESTSVTFDVSKLEKGGEYTYFCSFPGHWAVMNGKLIVK